jgi:energy-coupling factor transporter ATP-binding protein EcfA2
MCRMTKGGEMPAAVSIKNVTYTYEGEEKPVLKDLSMDFREGEICAVCGPSGCGKSTVLYLISGLIVALDGLSKLQNLDLDGMHALLAVGDVLAGFADLLSLVVELFVEHPQLLTNRLGFFLEGSNSFAQPFNLALTFEQAVFTFVRCKKSNAGTSQNIAAPGYQCAPRRQL